MEREKWKSRFLAMSEAIPALLLTAMFLAFIIQVFMRYVMKQPVGWTVEVQVIAWIWVILWGQSLSAREEDEIRFDILYGNVRPALRRAFRVIFSIFLIAIYGISLPAIWDYVSFMKIEKTSYLGIRYNYIFSAFIIFSVVSILRYALIGVNALRGRDAPEPLDETGSDVAARKDFTE